MMIKQIVQQSIKFFFPKKERSMSCQESTIAGFQFYRGDAIWDFLHEGEELYLEREPFNPHDKNAISVWFKKEKLGYIPQDENCHLARSMDIGRRHKARIISMVDNFHSSRSLRIGVNYLY